MKASVAIATVLLLVVLMLTMSPGQADVPAGPVELARLTDENWQTYVPAGKEVDAIVGDVVLRNRHLVAVIAEPLATRHANMTVKQVGGALVDLTTRESQSDQLSAFYPGKREFRFREWNGIDADGQKFDLAEGVTRTGANLQVRTQALAREGMPACTVEYRLGQNDRFLTVVSTFINSTDKPLTIALTDDLRLDGAKEEMVRTPNGSGPLFWAADNYWGQAYGIDVIEPKLTLQMQSDAKVSTLAYADADGGKTVTLEPGKSFQLTRRIYPGANLLDVKALAEELRGGSLQTIELVVLGDDQPLSSIECDILQDGASRGIARTDENGRIAVRLPEGDYTARFRMFGTDVSGNDGFRFKVAADTKAVRAKLAFRPGRVACRIIDSDGQPIPCKVEFKTRGKAKDDPEISFAPETGDFAVKNLRYAPLGEFEQELPPGRYDVIVSHGPEFDAIFTELEVPSGGKASLTGKLNRSVDTRGWVSGDFHSHSTPSGDNTSSQLGRVLNLLCEHVEFAPCTEHNRVDTYQPHIDRLQVGKFINTVSGIELTGSPLPLNHQNAFPMVRQARRQDGGGPTPDVEPESQIERLALWNDRSEKLVQVNHPDIGWMFYDRNGDGKPDAGFERMFGHIDVMEIHPVDNALALVPFETIEKRKGNNRVFNWLQLLNQGFRIPGVVNTDAHYNYHGSGGLRIWIQSPTDDPAAIQPLDVVHACEQGRMVMSNGPFLEVQATEAGGNQAVGPGSDLKAASKKVEVRIRVQCPNWLDIDRVFVLINGQSTDQANFSREKQPAKFRTGPGLKFDERVTLELPGDAHLVVVAGSEKSKLGPVMGPDWGKQRPAAIANPIFVDTNGNGFTPNKNTLGHPLPVKFKDSK